ncbi:MAG: PAS domain-containing protein [Rhodospirillaceae bacterium]|nr:PAS domain-containing protein [Rhodospirillaceae bacterium]
MTVPTPFAPNTPDDILEFYDHWASLPKRGLMPHLSDYLDRAPARLQPNVVIIDVSSPDEMIIRLFGTNIVDISGRELTTKSLHSVFAPQIWPDSCKRIWKAVTQPAGYYCIRGVRSSGDRMLHSPSVCLPVASGTGGRYCFMSYSIFPAASTMMLDERPDIVLSLELLHWIDIGAGVPKDI